MRNAMRSPKLICDGQDVKRMMDDIWQTKGCAHPLKFVGWKRASQISNSSRIRIWFSYKEDSRLLFRKGKNARPCDGKLKSLMAKIRRNYGKC